MQVGLANFADRHRGAAIGVYNRTGTQGLALGIANQVADGAGAQLGLFNDGEAFAGLQLSATMNRATIFDGAAIAPLYNRATQMRGVQIGLINRADVLHGVQIGVGNATRVLKGVQIGLLNVVTESTLPPIPILRWGF